MRVRGLGVVLGVALLNACPAPPEPPPSSEDKRLAELNDWERVVDPAEDLFADQRPAEAVCDDAGYFVDPLTQTFEIETDVCDYLTIRQPTLEPLEPGDLVTVQAYHDVLTAPEPAMGYMGLTIGGELEWEYFVEIPADAKIIEEELTIDRSLPAGTEMQVHVHNHGPNTWELVDILVTPAS